MNKRVIIVIANVLLIILFMLMKFYTITIDSMFIKCLIIFLISIWLIFNFYVLFFKKKNKTCLWQKINVLFIFVLIFTILIYSLQLLFRYYDGNVIEEYYISENSKYPEKLVVYTFGEKMKSGPTYIIYEKTIIGDVKCNILIDSVFEYNYDFDLIEEYNKIIDSKDKSFCHKKIERKGYIFN